MSRLDSLIRRLQAQRACLVYAVALIRQMPGPIFELGLGNGRTCDHLRELCPARAIFVFERHAPVNIEAGPAGCHLVLGDLRATFPALAADFAAQVPLIHSDIGSGDEAQNARIAAYLAGCLPPALAPGGVLVSDLPLPGLEDLALAAPAGVGSDRYFLYRRAQGVGKVAETRNARSGGIRAFRAP